MEVKGRDLVSGIPKIVRVHSSEIREAVQEPIQQIVDAVRRALEITPPELASDIVDRGIVMTGGGALIRGLDLLLQQETGLPIHLDERSEEHTSELQSRLHLVCRLLLEKKKNKMNTRRGDSIRI